MTELEKKDAEIQRWALRANKAEASLVHFDALHADGKFLSSAMSGPLQAIVDEGVHVATQSGIARLIAIPWIGEQRIVLVHPETAHGRSFWFADTRALMLELDWPAKQGWKGDFLGLMSKSTLAKTLQDFAALRARMADVGGIVGFDLGFRPQSVDGRKQ